MKTLIANALKLATVAATTAIAFAQPFYTLVELPTPFGYDFAGPSKINDQGFVVGSASGAKDPNGSAVVWKNGTVQVLGKLDKGISSLATAINAKGTIVGEGDDGDYRPLGWILSGGKLVNFFSNNGGNTHPLNINDSGDIGGYYIKGFDSQWRGAIWKVNAKDPRKSTLIDLPVLPGGDPTTASSVPWAFNQSMQAAGYSMNSAIGQRAAFWNNDATHSIVDLGVFGYDWSSLANGLNDIGQAVGSSHPPFGSRAVLWHNDPAHTAFELPLLPGDNYGSASLINNDGVIVGFSAYNEPGTWNTGPSELVIWIDGQVYDAQSVVRETADGWHIDQISSINNLGQLAGLATSNGVMHGIILNPIH
jgi:uncharacterized membrane protein